MNIVVVGSSNTDMIIKVPRIPKPGETILGGAFQTAAGGKGANQAVAAARAGGDVTFVARVGDDMFGEQAIKGFISDGINVDYVIKDKDAPSGVAEIFVADDGENSIGVASGANANLSVDDVAAAKAAIVKADIVVMQLESPLETIAAAAQLAMENRVEVILNPAPAQPLPDELLALISILTPNESEAELLTGVAVHDGQSAEKAADILKSKGIKTVIITMGSAGVFIASNEFTGQQGGFKVEPVDTTAAGDVFNGALAVGLAANTPLLEAVRFAQAAAALSVTKLGAQPSAPKKEHIATFLA